MNKACFTSTPIRTTLRDKHDKVLSTLWLADGHLFQEKDEQLAWERLRINRECTSCGELTNNTNMLICHACIEKQEIERYKNLPTDTPTEVLYSAALNEYIQTDSIQEFLDNEDEELSIEDLRLVNTTTEELNLVTSIENAISDFFSDTRYEEDEFILPDSLIHELEQFATTLPKIYYPAKTRPKL